MKTLKTFILFCSGAAPQLLKRCPTEISKYAGIGASVMFTAIFAATAAGYALSTISDSIWITVGVAILWGGMIFNLDRFIVSSMRKNNLLRNDLMLATPRFVMAIVIALVVSKPLELKIFEKEINRKIDEKRTAEALVAKRSIALSFPEVEELEKKILALKSEVKEKEDFRNVLQMEYDAERFGKKTSGTTGVSGIGTNAKKKEIQLDEAQKELYKTADFNRIKITELEKQVSVLSSQKTTEYLKQKPGIDKYDGLAARIHALSVLTEESNAMNLVNIFLVLLFIVIETTPILVKLMSQRGPYDELLEVHEHTYRNYRKERIAKSDHKTLKRLQDYVME
ncbi:MAG: hypothetical protein K0S26_2600 [Bacteroidota bacterium]|jgi:hypothetical protein|nr:hypothetical protein [Bacteroidota bacterium]